jgi:hypothetical protein
VKKKGLPRKIFNFSCYFVVLFSLGSLKKNSCLGFVIKFYPSYGFWDIRVNGGQNQNHKFFHFESYKRYVDAVFFCLSYEIKGANFMNFLPCVCYKVNYFTMYTEYSLHNDKLFPVSKIISTCIRHECTSWSSSISYTCK